MANNLSVGINFLPKTKIIWNVNIARVRKSGERVMVGKSCDGGKGSRAEDLGQILTIKRPHLQQQMLIGKFERGIMDWVVMHV